MNALRELLHEKGDTIAFDPTVPRRLRTRIRIRRTVIVLGLVCVVAALVVVTSSILPTVESSIGPAERRDGSVPGTQPVPGEFQQLREGRWVARDFVVPFSFRVPVGWEMREYTRDFLAIEHRDIGDIAFSRPTFAYHPTRENERIAPPANLLAWLQDHPDIDIGTIERYAVGDVEGIRIEMRATRVYRSPKCIEPCLPLTFSEGAPASFQLSQRFDQKWIFEVGGETVIVGNDPYELRFEREGERLLKTVRFND